MPRFSGNQTLGEFARDDGAGVTVIGWRRSNLILVVVGTSFPPASIEALARLVDGRASGIA